MKKIFNLKNIVSVTCDLVHGDDVIYFFSHLLANAIRQKDNTDRCIVAVKIHNKSIPKTKMASPL